MNFPAPLSKVRYGAMLAAALAHLIARQGDSVGFVGGDRFVPDRSGRQQLRRVLAALSSLDPRGTWDGSAVLRRAAERLKGRGMLIVISDFYDDEERTIAELRRAARRGHEVVLFQVLSRDELDLPYGRDLEFTDLETNARLAVNAADVRHDYKEAVGAFLERMRGRAVSEGFQYSLALTSTPPDRLLRQFLLARRR